MELVFSYIGPDGASLRAAEKEKAAYKIIEVDEDIFSWERKVAGEWYPGMERASLSRIEGIIEAAVRKPTVVAQPVAPSVAPLVVENTLHFDDNARELERGKTRNATSKAVVMSDGTTNLYVLKKGNWELRLSGTLLSVREYLDKMAHKGGKAPPAVVVKPTLIQEQVSVATVQQPAPESTGTTAPAVVQAPAVVYFDKRGTLLNKEGDKASRYKVVSEGEDFGSLCKKKSTTWVKLAEGTLSELMENLDKLCVEAVMSHKKVIPAVAEEKSVKETKQNSAESEVIITQPADAADAPNATKVLYHRIKSHTSYTLKELNDYLYICMCRNRKIKNTSIINTRLTDYMGQELYVVDTGWGTDIISQENLRVVDSLRECKGVLSTCEATVLPPPLQWSIDPADYIWDSTVKVLPISIETFDHITKDRSGRLPEQLRNLSPTTLIDNIRRAIAEGEAMSCRDVTYALPSYSRKYDRVNMLLPLRFMSDRSQVPEAVMLITKSTMGYRLCTIITPEQAYVGVRAIRDPNLTWLKGVRA